LRNIVPHNAGCAILVYLLLLGYRRCLRANAYPNGNHFPDGYANADNDPDWGQSDTDSKRDTNGIGDSDCFRYTNRERYTDRECNTNRQRNARRTNSNSNGVARRERSVVQSFHARACANRQWSSDWRLRD
jgi:hypothetical protein